MEGQAKIETFDYIGDDPNTAPLLKEMRDPDGKPHVCDHVWISYLTGSPDRGTLGEGFGKLTAGYGSRSDPKEERRKIGPEFTFGLTMEKAYDGPILIIKTAWGGKSLNTDFRPPSAGPYEFSEDAVGKPQEAGQGHRPGQGRQGQGDRPVLQADDRPRQEGARRPQAGRARPTTRRRATRSPGSSGSRAGTTWSTAARIPNRREPDGYAKYSEWMADFIRDVRKDLGAPKMPFVIGVMGVGGVKDKPRLLPPGHGGPGGDAGVQGQRHGRGDRTVLGQDAGGHRRRDGRGRQVGLLPPQGRAEERHEGPDRQRRSRQVHDENGKVPQNKIKAFVAEYRAKRIGPEKEAYVEDAAPPTPATTTSAAPRPWR